MWQAEFRHEGNLFAGAAAPPPGSEHPAFQRMRSRPARSVPRHRRLGCSRHSPGSRNRRSVPRKPLLNACFILPESSAGGMSASRRCRQVPIRLPRPQAERHSGPRIETNGTGQFHDDSRSEGRSTEPQTESNSVGSNPTGFPSIRISAAPSSSRPTQSAKDPPDSAISPPV